MKLATFTHEGRTRIGVVDADGIIDLELADPRLPASMVDLLTAGEPALDAVRVAAARTSDRIPLGAARLEPPVPRPRKYLAIGLNYAQHIAGAGGVAPEFPRFFNKQTTCIIGTGDPIHRPRASEELDYEGELAFVIGKRCRHVPRALAHRVIGGYLIANDVSVRDWQRKAATVTLGKSWDTHGPLGPWIVTPDEIGDPHVLGLKTWVNGELRQDSNTKLLVHDCFEIVEILSTVFTLEPGDIVATGTPSGVGMGFKPPKYLKAGDVVRIEIDGIGSIENPVIDEPSDNVRIEER
jgi:2-keto-4-pentenoate hydratase/2-oxohepta-3-ene-1,7-dioic acid hydratase in catechol pathway